MKRFLFLCAVLALVTASPAVLQTKAIQSNAAAGSVDPHRAMLTTYCITCHSTRAKSGGLVLEGLNLNAAADDAETWEKAIRKLRGRLMPPPGSPQPEQKDIDSFVSFLENSLDQQAKGPKAGYVPIQRLTRTEYVAAVKALVGVDVTAKDVLPSDVAVDGFDNIAAVLSVSPTFVEQYVESARMIAKKAVGDTGLDNVMYPLETEHRRGSHAPRTSRRRPQAQAQFHGRRRIPFQGAFP